MAIAEHQLDPFRLTGNQGIHQLVSHPQLKPVAGECMAHPDAMAPVFGLFCIAWGPRSLNQEHVPSPVESEAQAARAIGGYQQGNLPGLEAIHLHLSLRGIQGAGEHHATTQVFALAVKHASRVEKCGEHHH